MDIEKEGVLDEKKDKTTKDFAAIEGEPGSIDNVSGEQKLNTGSAEDDPVSLSEEHENTKSKKKHKKGAEKELESLHNEISELKDKYLRMYSEFENYRRRTSKEKLELIKTAGEDILIVLLPVIDDFERALKSFTDISDINPSINEGILLIYNKLKYTTEQKGLKVMNTEKGAEFDPEIHEAITKIPVDDENLKGKIVEVVERGYYLHDKVIRFAKVITGT